MGDLSGASSVIWYGIFLKIIEFLGTRNIKTTEKHRFLKLSTLKLPEPWVKHRSSVESYVELNPAHLKTSCPFKASITLGKCDELILLNLLVFLLFQLIYLKWLRTFYLHHLSIYSIIHCLMARSQDKLKTATVIPVYKKGYTGLSPNFFYLLFLSKSWKN